MPIPGTVGPPGYPGSEDAPPGCSPSREFQLPSVGTEGVGAIVSGTQPSGPPGRPAPRRRSHRAPRAQRAGHSRVPPPLAGHGRLRDGRLAEPPRALRARHPARHRLPGAELRPRRCRRHEAAARPRAGPAGRRAGRQVRPAPRHGRLRPPALRAVPVDPAGRVAVVAARRHPAHRDLRAVLDPGQGRVGAEPAAPPGPDRDGEPARPGDDLRRRGDHRVRAVHGDLRPRRVPAGVDAGDLHRLRRAGAERAGLPAHRHHGLVRHPRDLRPGRAAPRGRSGAGRPAARRRCSSSRARRWSAGW